MIHIIITIDHEIFGNGKGDVKKHMISPMNRMLAVSNKFGVPLTIMFEVMEYIHFTRYDKELQKKLGYSPRRLIEEQLRSAYQKGNDIQLHIHPQFAKMRYKKGILVPVDPRLSIFDFDKKETYKLLKNSKNTLESLIPSNKYKCVALRLSNMGWIKAPSHVAEVMEKIGIKVHSLSSICAPVNDTGYFKLYDTATYEIPIYTIPAKWYSFIRPQFIRSLLYLWVHDPPISPTSNPHPPISDISNDCKGVGMKWDMSKLSWKTMVSMLKYAIRSYNYRKFEIPLVMIGHTKDFMNDKHFEKFLQVTIDRYVSRGIVKFTTFSEFVRENL